MEIYLREHHVSSDDKRLCGVRSAGFDPYAESAAGFLDDRKRTEDAFEIVQPIGNAQVQRVAKQVVRPVGIKLSRDDVSPQNQPGRRRGCTRIEEICDLCCCHFRFPVVFAAVDDVWEQVPDDRVGVVLVLERLLGTAHPWA